MRVRHERVRLKLRTLDVGLDSSLTLLKGGRYVAQTGGQGLWRSVVCYRRRSRESGDVKEQKGSAGGVNSPEVQGMALRHTVAAPQLVWALSERDVAER